MQEPLQMHPGDKVAFDSPVTPAMLGSVLLTIHGEQGEILGSTNVSDWPWRLAARLDHPQQWVVVLAEERATDPLELGGIPYRYSLCGNCPRITVRLQAPAGTRFTVRAGFALFIEPELRPGVTFGRAADGER